MRRFAFLFFVLSLMPTTLLAEGGAPAAKFNCSDMSCSILAPQGWHAREDQTGDAQIRIASPSKETFTNVWVEPKASFTGDLRKLADTRVQEMLKNLTESTRSKEETVTLGELHGVQYTIGGTAQKFKIKFLYTLVEGQSNYYRILQWTEEPKFKGELDTFRSILESFKGK